MRTLISLAFALLLCVSAYSQTTAVPMTVSRIFRISGRSGDNLGSGIADHGTGDTDRTMKLWFASVVFLIGSNCLDLASSHGGIEANPVMRSHQIPLKIAATGVIVGAEYIFMRRHKGKRESVVTNFAAGGALTGIAIRNWKVK